MNLQLPHWAQLVIAGAIVAVAWLMNEQASGALVLPAVAVSALTVLKVVLQMLQPAAPAAAAPPKGPQAGFVRLGMLGVLAAVAGLSAAVGCGFFNHEAPVLKQDATVDVPCVLSAVLGGGGDLAACGVTAMGQLGGILGDLIAYYESQNAPADAGAAGALPVPFKGIPARLNADQLAKLKAFAQSLKDAGK